MSLSVEEKLRIIKEKNTYFASASPEVEEKYQKIVEETVSALKKWKQIIEESKPSEDKDLQRLLADFISKENHGLRAALVLCGLSNEKMFRIFSFLRAAYAEGRYKTNSSWVKEGGSEWKEDKILAKLKSDPEFALDFAKILLGKEPLVTQVLSPFERMHFKKEKFLFIEDALLDALARYSLHGSYSAAKGGGAELILKQILDDMGILYTSGKIKGIDRRIDFIIPSKQNPKIFMEVAFVETTSSGMGDKAKTERDTVAKSIKQYYSNAIFVLFVDGAGWLVREEAMRIMCEAADYVFTFHPEQLEEFKKLVSKIVSKEDYRPRLNRFFEDG